VEPHSLYDFPHQSGVSVRTCIPNSPNATVEPFQSLSSIIESSFPTFSIFAPLRCARCFAGEQKRSALLPPSTCAARCRAPGRCSPRPPQSHALTTSVPCYRSLLANRRRCRCCSYDSLLFNLLALNILKYSVIQDFSHKENLLEIRLPFCLLQP
jgi:hypothetical protein